MTTGGPAPRNLQLSDLSRLRALGLSGNWLIPAGAVGTPPPGPGIEALLISFDALPTNELRTIVIVDRFHDMIRFAIASLAAMDRMFELIHSIPQRIARFKAKDWSASVLACGWAEQTERR